MVHTDSRIADTQTHPQTTPRVSVETYSTRGLRPSGTKWINGGCTMVQDSLKTGLKLVRYPISSGASEWASERTNERRGARERSEQCGASERASGRVNSEWPSTYVPIKEEEEEEKEEQEEEER